MKLKFVFIILLAVLFVSCEELVSENGERKKEPQKVETTTQAKSQDMVTPKAQLTTQKSIPKHLAKIDVAYLQGRFVPAKHEDFIAIERKHADRAGLYMRKDAYEDFKRMAAAAQKDGIKLTIRSAVRNFDKQKQIWEGKWTGVRKVGGKDLSKTVKDPGKRALKILEYSSMPGTSRHHWGTDIDLNAFTNDFFAKGEGLKIYKWLTAHAAEYGYCQVYTPKGAERPNGYNEEKWHWSYLPVAQTLTTLYKTKINNEEITGFKGAEVAAEINVVNHYVLGINKACL